jgi:hypothetical protein
MNIVPAIQKIRSEKQLPVDALLTVTMAVGLAITTVNRLYDSSGTVYYTNKGIAGRNKEEAELMTRLNNQTSEDGNF